MAKPYAHLNTWMIEVLVLLKMDISSKDVFIIVEGVCPCTEGGTLKTEGQEYFYSEHTCPYNYLGFPMMVNGDNDDHGIFKWVASIVKPEDYDPAMDGAFELFDLEELR